MNTFKRIKAIARREFMAYFSSALAYVFMGIFLILSSLLTFNFADWFELNEASLRSFFNFHPYLYLLFIPAIGMRVWSEEDKEGTLELLLTMPISVWHAVVGKFLAGWLFIGFTLLLTFPMVLTVFYLGDPDSGRLFSGYLGSFLVGGMCLSLTSLASAFTRNQVISYLLGFSVLLLISVIGMPQLGLSSYLESFLSQSLIETIIFFSLQPHFEGLQRGVLDIRDLIYFLSFIGFGLLCSTIILRCRKAAHQYNKLLTTFGFVVMFIILLLANYLIRGMNGRLDLSADRLYTLSESTKAIIKNLEAPVTVRFYYSKTDDSLPIQTKALALRIEDLIKEYAALSGNQITWQIIDPQPGSNEAKGAELDGIEPVAKKDGSKYYFGLSISYRDSIKTIPVLSQEQEKLLEYHLTQLFKHLQQPKKPVIGILTDIPIVEQQANPMAGIYQNRPAWRILDELKRDYDIRQIGDHYIEWGYDPQTGKNLMDLVIIYQFKPLTEAVRFAMDQYLMRGGKLIFLTDSLPFVGMEADNTFKMQDKRLPYLSNLVGISESWKISYDYRHLVIDSGSSTSTSQGNINTMLTLKEGLNRQFKSLSSIDKIVMPYAGSFKYEKLPGIQVEPIMSTSKQARLISSRRFRDKEAHKNLDTQQQQLPLALYVKGKLPSFYKGSPLKKEGVLNEAKEISEVILIGDMDWLKDKYTFVSRKKALSSERVRISDNVDAFVNMVDQLLPGDDMIHLRMRRETKRELEKLTDLRKKVLDEHREEIRTLKTEYNEKSAVVQKLHLKQENQQVLKADEVQKLAGHERRVDEISERLNAIQAKLKNAEQSFKKRVLLINTATVPALIIIFWLIAFSIRSRRARS